MVTLHTIVYEGNFNDVLNKNSWFLNFKSKFIQSKLITINNISSKENVLSLISELKKQFDFDFIFVEDFKEHANSFFGLNINESIRGYVYTMPYFTALLNIKTKYVLNIATDCMRDNFISDDFILDSVKEIEESEKCCTTMVVWGKEDRSIRKGVAEIEQIACAETLNLEPVETQMFNYRANFTDQFFFGSVDILKKIDYNLGENLSEIIYHGPSYGGNCFEKRMVAHHVKNQVYNCVYKGLDYYVHDVK